MPVTHETGLPPAEEKNEPCAANESLIARVVMTAPSLSDDVQNASQPGDTSNSTGMPPDRSYVSQRTVCVDRLG